MFFYSKGNTVYYLCGSVCNTTNIHQRGWCSYWEAANTAASQYEAVFKPVFKRSLIKNLKPRVKDNMVVCFVGRRSGQPGAL